MPEGNRKITLTIRVFLVRQVVESMAMLNGFVFAFYLSAGPLLTNALSSALQYVLTEQVQTQNDDGEKLNAVHDKMHSKALGIARSIIGTEDLRSDGVSDGPSARKYISIQDKTEEGKTYINVPVTVTSCFVRPPVLPVTSARLSTATAPNPWQR